MSSNIKKVIAVALFNVLLASAPLLCHAEIMKAVMHRLTIKDAITLAYKNNRAIQVQEQQVGYAKADVLYAQSLFLPQVGTGYSYTFNDSVLYSDSLPHHRKDTRIYSGFKNDNDFGLALDQSIYNGGADIATLKQSKINLKIQLETLRATQLDIEFETKRLFYGLLLAYETRRIAKDLVTQAEAHYRDVKRKYEQGTASKFDLLQSKVQVSNVIPQLVYAENSIDLIKADFKKLLVIPLTEDIDADGVLDYTLIDIKEDMFVVEAYQNNPQMILKALGVDLNKWGIEYAKSGWMPQLSASANYGYRTDNINNWFNERHSMRNIGVKASIALFDGFATKAKVDEAKAKYNQASIEKLDIAEAVAVLVTTACIDLRQAKAIIDSQKDGVVEAKEALRLSIVRYDTGVGINLDVLDSEVSLAQVEQTLAQGIFDYVIATAQLNRTLGREFLKETNS